MNSSVSFILWLCLALIVAGWMLIDLQGFWFFLWLLSGWIDNVFQLFTYLGADCDTALNLSWYFKDFLIFLGFYKIFYPLLFWKH